MPITLRSNSGEASFCIEIGATVEYGGELGFESTVRVNGSHWDGDHTFPFSSNINGLWLRAESLTELGTHVANWVGRPMDNLIASELTGDFDLARLPGQQVSVEFGPRPDVVTTPNPVVSVLLSAGTFKGEFNFVTDQSCLNLFVQELQAALLAVHEASS